MTFARQIADKWHRDVPGSRWFKADLHIHTVDDIPGRRAKFPSDINGLPTSAETIVAYARRFLQEAASREVRVLGVTPHSPRLGTGPETSAVWSIVDEWNTGIDDDGKPFREKVYAVFPGFEPSFNQGRSGLHLLFLFDPEIGREHYFRAFNLVMGGVSPWDGNELQLSSRSASDAFDELQNFHSRENRRGQDGVSHWDYMTLAPHIDQEKGLLGSQRAHVLELFQHGEVAGLELADSKLPEHYRANQPWLKESMIEYRQSFYHSSDAYKVDEIGKRHTWLKLASPRIEALRQAFIASDSRIRIGYEQDTNGQLSEISNPLDVTMHDRPWLKAISVTGGASFFGKSGLGNSGSRFNLSPDLTCIIGGSMTGKSTLLDGLRIHVGAPMPDGDALANLVTERGRDGFLGGSPDVELECPGRDTTAPLHEQWPAVFYTQSELQQLAQNDEAVEDILARLTVSETQTIAEVKRQLATLDTDLRNAARAVSKLYEDVADAEQAHERSKIAASELASFADAGVERLSRASSDSLRWQESVNTARVISGDLTGVLEAAEALDLPETDESLASTIRDAGISDNGSDVRDRWRRISDLLRTARSELGAVGALIRSIAEVLEKYEQDIRVQVDRELASRGLDGARINQLQALNSQASLMPSYAALLAELSTRLANAERSFERLLAERETVVSGLRSAYDRVIETVREQFDGRIMVRRIDNGLSDPLDRFINGLTQRGITRWWNGLIDGKKPSPRELLDKLEAGKLADKGMSDAVQETFRESLTLAKRRELAAIRCSDSYVIETEVGDGTYRSLNSLSGGQRVNTLLTLLLETNDDRPLMIDQPEDQLDNRFLFETLLPALKRLKGRRQIVVATHNANIVVNGDADQVIQLEATSTQGRVACAGAIEDPAVRDAIVRTVDGGDEAFRLRRLKYGF